MFFHRLAAAVIADSSTRSMISRFYTVSTLFVSAACLWAGRSLARLSGVMITMKSDTAWGSWHVVLAPREPYAPVWWPASLELAGVGFYSDGYQFMTVYAPSGWRQSDVMAVLTDAGLLPLDIVLCPAYPATGRPCIPNSSREDWLKR